MSQMMMLWMAIGLSILGTILMWFGMFNAVVWTYLGLVFFVVAMLISPLTKFIGKEEAKE